MPGPQQPEVPVVERRQLRLPQPLHNAQHRRIDEPDARIRVLLTDFGGAGVVLREQVLDGVRASDDVGEEGNKNLGR